MPADSKVRRVAKRLLAPVLNDRFYSYVQSMAMTWDIKRGDFSEPELTLLPRMVRKGDTVIDIGANYGLYSYYLSRAVGAEGHVYAFEPVPFTCRTLRLVAANLRLRNVEIIQKGCSFASGKITFTVPLQVSGAPVAGLAHIRSRTEDSGGSGEIATMERVRQIECEVVALDEALAGVTNLSFIKCDIEGAELFAFRGAEGLIKRHRPSVLCEINQPFLERFEIHLEDLVGFFTDKQYQVFSYDESAHRLAPADGLAHLPPGNYLFVHDQNVETVLRDEPSGR